MYLRCCSEKGTSTHGIWCIPPIPTIRTLQGITSPGDLPILQPRDVIGPSRLKFLTDEEEGETFIPPILRGKRKQKTTKVWWHQLSNSWLLCSFPRWNWKPLEHNQSINHINSLTHSFKTHRSPPYSCWTRRLRGGPYLDYDDEHSLSFLSNIIDIQCIVDQVVIMWILFYPPYLLYIIYC